LSRNEYGISNITYKKSGIFLVFLNVRILDILIIKHYGFPASSRLSLIFLLNGTVISALSHLYFLASSFM